MFFASQLHENLPNGVHIWYTGISSDRRNLCRASGVEINTDLPRTVSGAGIFVVVVAGKNQHTRLQTWQAGHLAEALNHRSSEVDDGMKISAKIYPITKYPLYPFIM